MTMQNLIETIDHFIKECEIEMESISWDIREETNYELNAIDYLSERYDHHKELLNDLKTIRMILETQSCS